MTRRPFDLSRRSLVKGVAVTGALGAMLAARRAPAQTVGDRPVITNGVQSGDVSGGNAVIWSRTDRPSRMIVDYATTESMANVQRVVSPLVLESSDFTAKVALENLPAGQTVFYRVAFEDLANPGVMSEQATGRLRTPGTGDISFTWSGDTAGQGWGIDEARGGMTIYETMRTHNPDFFLHSGDTIYADGPLKEEVELADGTMWRNIVIPEKTKVAETLAEYRGNFRYNLMDTNVRALAAEVPMLVQWDDHETLNNWYPGEMLLADDRYTVKSSSLLAANSRQAFFEYMPIRTDPSGAMRVQRVIRRGAMLDIFFLDMRTYRGPNTPNREEGGTPFLGAQQIAWLKRELLNSKATWKAIASDMPIGLMVADGETNFEAVANGDGPALGREVEMAGLLRFIRDAGIRNVVWFTADVHYTAAHRYDPNGAQFTEFAPFWEFVSGPLNAGTYGPNALDNTFGPQVVYQKAPAEGQANLPPSDGLQFFGHVRIDGATQVMTVTLRDAADNALWSIDLEPELA